MISAAPSKSSRNNAAPRMSRRELIRQTREMLATEISFIPNARFMERSHAELARRMDAASSNAKPTRVPAGMPAHLAQLCSAPLLTPPQEKALFCRMNYLKFRANAIRSTLDEARPNKRKLDEIRRLLSEAIGVRNEILHANTRLVVSIIKSFADDHVSFDDLLSEGIDCALKTIEKFDFDRGFRFSTYATMAIRREALRVVRRAHRDRSRFTTGAAMILDQEEESSDDGLRGENEIMSLNAAVTSLLENLDDREQFIVRARYGMEDIGAKPTFARLGEHLGVSKERVRQLEMRALRKLYELATDFGLTDPGLE